MVEQGIHLRPRVAAFYLERIGTTSRALHAPIGMKPAGLGTRAASGSRTPSSSTKPTSGPPFGRDAACERVVPHKTPRPVRRCTGRTGGTRHPALIPASPGPEPNDIEHVFSYKAPGRALQFTFTPTEQLTAPVRQPPSSKLTHSWPHSTLSTTDVPECRPVCWPRRFCCRRTTRSAMPKRTAGRVWTWGGM